MAGRLASVPEFGEWHNRDPAQSPPLNLYRDLIRNVAVSGGQYITQAGHSGSSYSHSSGASSSYCSSGSAASTAATAEFCAADDELTTIARRMVNDGFARRMINEFSSGDPDHAPLETWFLELDVNWVLQIRDKHGLRRQLQDNKASSLQELVDKWIRALTVIVVSMGELVLVVTVDEMPVVAQFGKASMAKMFVFFDAIIPALKEEKLQALAVDMYVCVSNASYRFEPYYRSTRASVSLAASIIDEIYDSLSGQERRLSKAISSMMEETMALLEDDDLWPIASGEVHRKTRFMVYCIMPMVKARGSMSYPAQRSLPDLIDISVQHLKDLLVRKSKLCSDPSLRYLFLLNNFYSVAQLSGPGPGENWVHTLVCKKYMDSYIDVSWGHVISCLPQTDFKDSRLDVSCGQVLFSIPKTCFSGSRQRRKMTSFSLAEFDSAFHKTYQAQKSWKVPDPQLRDMLRKTITEKVISDYSCYLKKHPQLEKHVSSGSSSPDVLKEMLGELFEG